VKLAIEIVAAIVVVLLLAGTLLRVRKIRRDEKRELSRPLDRRLVVPPPSPYAPSKGFRVLDGSDQSLDRPAMERPRIDPARHYVFSDPDEPPVIRARHNEDWFLSRSAHRSTASVVGRAVAIVVVVGLVIAVVVTYYVHHDPAPKQHTGDTTTTTTKPPPTTTTTAAALNPTSTSGDDAVYDVSASRYRVTVYGARGETWTVYNMGPSNTLEWQGAVAEGSHESLVMIGDSRITLGSPSSARATLDGRPVVFPLPLPATLVLVFTVSNPTTP
jgi:FlaG/FlaF family flagellin (archaellin)